MSYLHAYSIPYNNHTMSLYFKLGDAKQKCTEIRACNVYNVHSILLKQQMRRMFIVI